MADAAFITTLADQVVSDLNDGAFSIGGLKAERIFTPRQELESIDELTVVVIPAASRQAPDNRTEWSYEYEIHVLVQRKVKGDADNKQMDSLLLLCQEIADKYRATGPAITGQNLITLSLVEIPQIWLQDHLEKYGLFTSVVTLTFRTWK